jgi:Ca2+-transporting ATPase
VFLELVIDPVCSIAFEAEPEERDIMRRPPRDPKTPLFSSRDIGFSLALGTIGLFSILAAYGLALGRGAGDAEARAVAFIAIVTTNLTMILSDRLWYGSALASVLRPNAVLWGIMAAAAAMLALVVYLPQAAELFQFAPPDGLLLLLALIPALALLFATETAKLIRPRARDAAIRRRS